MLFGWYLCCLQVQDHNLASHTVSMTEMESNAQPSLHVAREELVTREGQIPVAQQDLPAVSMRTVPALPLRHPQLQGPPPQTLQVPLARIRRIIKEDEDVNVCSSDAVTLISITTEMFAEYLSKRSFDYAKKDKRKTLLLKDIARAVKENDDLFFLSDAMVELVSSVEIAKRERQAAQAVSIPEQIAEAEQDAEGEESPPASSIEETHWMTASLPGQ